MIKYDIDQFTVVAQASDSNLDNMKNLQEWENLAENVGRLIFRFMKIEQLYEQVEKLDRTYIQGYTASIGTVSENPIIFAYNAEQPAMGVCIKFTAQAWKNYRERYKQEFDVKMTIGKFLRLVSNSDEYTIRLSRIDCVADFIDESIDLTQLYDDLTKQKTITICYNKELEKSLKTRIRPRKNLSKISCHAKENDVLTIYIGTRLKSTTSLLRIYDKKVEQLDKLSKKAYRETDTSENLARTCDNWIRYEVEYKGQNAHDITTAFLTSTTEKDERDLIIQLLLKKYIFWDNKHHNLHYISRAVIDDQEKDDFDFSSISRRKNSLERSFAYIQLGSGLYSLIYKSQQIYGDSALDEIFDVLKADYSNYNATAEDLKWLRKNKDVLQHQKKFWTNKKVDSDMRNRNNS